MKFTTRKQRINFDVRSDLKARQKARLLLSAVLKGHMVRLQSPNLPVQPLFAQKHSLNANNAPSETLSMKTTVSMYTVLSTRPAIHKVL